MRKRMISLLLVLALCLSLVPGVLAAETTEPGLYWDGQKLDQTEGVYVCPYAIGGDPNHQLVYRSAREIESVNLEYPDGMGLSSPLPSDQNTTSVKVFLPEAKDFDLTMTISFADQTTENLTVQFRFQAVAEAHAVTEADLFGPEPETGAVPFTLHGETYYLGVTFAPNWQRGLQPLDVVSHSDLTTQNSDYHSTLVAELRVWTKDDMGYHLVEDEAVLSAVQNPTLRLCAMELKNQYPALLSEQQAYPCTRRYDMTKDNNNRWVLEGSAKIGGQTVTTRGLYGWKVLYEWPGETDPFDTVEKINTWLADLEPADIPADAAIALQLKGQAYTGKIVIPADLPEVRLLGQPDRNGKRTVLTGSIEANTQTVLSELDLVAPTPKAAAFDPAAVTADSTESCGVSGTGNVQYNMCSFTGYDVAVKCIDGLRFGGMNSRFADNHIGVYVDTVNEDGGNTWMSNFVFENNDIGVYLKQIPQNIEPWQFSMNGCHFQNNEEDMFSALDRWTFFPGNLFEHGTRKAPVLDGQISVYPTLTKLPGSWEEPMSYDYSAAEAPMANQLAGNYPIPADNLPGKTVTVIDSGRDGDEQLAAMTFPEAKPQVRLLAMTLAEPETFDATVTVERTADEIRFTMADPLGKQPTVAIPCAWTDVTVTFGDTVVPSKADGETISFLAEAGGTYVISNEEEETPVEPSRPVTPVRPEKEPEAKPDGRFSDVASDAWYYDAVQTVVEQGLMNGVGGGRFAPEDSASRAMILTMLARMEQVNLEGGSIWYEKAVAWAAAEGISDGTNPEGVITRQQLVTMLWRYAGSPKAAGSLEQFRDADQVAPWAVEAMTWAVDQGLVSGMGDGCLNPSGTATRAQIAKIFCGYAALIG